MNKRIVFQTLGKIILLVAALMLLPFVVSVIYINADSAQGIDAWRTAFSFLATSCGAAVIGGILLLTCRTKNRMIFAREGFAIVALSWVALSLIGAVPFVLSGEVPSYFDALFETASGFTTTGASVITNVESLSHGLLFWRSFTHWIGGMGVLVLIMALFPSESGRSMHIMRAEMPGPQVGKIVPRLRDTAVILYLIYIVLTIVEIIMLTLGDMNLFEAFVHSFGTAGTGGFGIKADSVASYSAYSQWVITAFMLIFGVNFNLYYMLLLKRVGDAVKSRELWIYSGIIVVSAVAITIINAVSMSEAISGQSIREATFQVSSIITTTGYATTDFNLWPTASKAIIFLLMFLGGCAGSTAGGLKLARVILIAKVIGRDIKKMLHPHSVSTVKFEGKRIDDETSSGVTTYFAIYAGFIAIVFLLISFDPNIAQIAANTSESAFETNFTAAVTCLNNVGPGLGAIVGPAGSFSVYSNFSKIVLTFAMLLGRLEIFPLLFACTPGVWRKRG